MDRLLPVQGSWSMSTHYDIIIIGTGPGGGTLAYGCRLREADSPLGAWRLSAT